MVASYIGFNLIHKKIWKFYNIAKIYFELASISSIKLKTKNQKKKNQISLYKCSILVL